MKTTQFKASNCHFKSYWVQSGFRDC